jgi:hypothetical protein
MESFNGATIRHREKVVRASSVRTLPYSPDYNCTITSYVLTWACRTKSPPPRLRASTYRATTSS